MLKKINETTFKNENKEFEVEIGDSKQPDFKPQVKLKRWDNECNFSCRLIDDDEDFVIESNKGKISYKKNKKECHFYEVEKGFEFDIVLKEKPKSNKIDFSIQSKELKFFYQPELTNDELAEGNYRPEDVVGSYAVYHMSKKDHIIGQKNYRAGKAFHIYRPKIFDNENNWAWGELNIDINKGILSVTIPQSFLDNAIYPIRNAAGLVFGYETAGTTGSAFLSNAITGSIATGGAGTGVSIEMYHSPNLADCSARCAIYVHSDLSLLTNGTTVPITNITGAQWTTYNFITPPTLTAIDYILVGWGKYLLYVSDLIYYDTGGGTNQGHYSVVTFVKDSGTTDGASAFHLIDVGNNFLTTVSVGMVVENVTDNNFANVTAVNSDSDLTVDADIFPTGKTFSIYNFWPTTLVPTHEDRIYSIHCNYTAGGTNYTQTCTESYSMVPLITKSESRNLSQAFSVSDSRQIEERRTISEELSLSDNYSRMLGGVRNYSEGLSLSDLGIKSILRTVTQNFNISDSKSFQITKSRSESLSLSASRVMSIVKMLAENYSITDDFDAVKLAIKELTEVFNLADAYSRIWEIGREYSESYSLNDLVNRLIQRAISETINLVDEFLGAKIIAKEFTESINLIETKYFGIIKSLSENLLISDGDTKQFYRLLLENIQTNANYSRVWQIVRAYSEGINLTDLKETARIKELLETLNLSDGDAFINYIKLLNESFNIDDHFIKFITNWATSSTIRTDIQDIIEEQGISATLIRQTETTDSQGAITAISEENYTIYMAAQDILRSDRQMREMGLALPGTERVFMFHEYPDSITGNGTMIPQVGDMIKDDENIYWRIEEITGEREMEGSEIFKSALIKKIDLTQ